MPTHNIGSFRPFPSFDLPDTDALWDVHGDLSSDLDTDVCDGCGDLPHEVEISSTDALDPCACKAGKCGELPGCPDANCGKCFVGEYCLDGLCVPEGSVGTPCEDDLDCPSEAPCIGTDPQVCSMACDEDWECLEGWSCLEQPGDLLLCIPFCNDAPECGDESCGFLPDGCGTFVPCGPCDEGFE